MWKPIHTAPRGVPILVWDGDNISIAEGSDTSDRWYAVADGGYASTPGYGDELIHLKPLDWMPLPEHP